MKGEASLCVPRARTVSSGKFPGSCQVEQCSTHSLYECSTREDLLGLPAQLLVTVRALGFRLLLRDNGDPSLLLLGSGSPPSMDCKQAVSRIVPRNSPLHRYSRVKPHSHRLVSHSYRPGFAGRTEELRSGNTAPENRTQYIGNRLQFNSFR